MHDPHTIDHKITVEGVVVSYDEDTMLLPLEADPWPISVCGKLLSPAEAMQVSNHLRVLALPLLKDKP